MVCDKLSCGLALVAGLVSFRSPCVRSLVPVHLGYLGSQFVTPGGAATAPLRRYPGPVAGGFLALRRTVIRVGCLILHERCEVS